MPSRYGGLLALSNEMELNSIRPASLRKLELAQSWHWSVFQPISGTTEGSLEWWETP